MTRFLFIRHATTDTVGKRIAGRMAGVHLNEEGKEQARQLAERLRTVPVQTIYSSPLERAMETAAPLAQRHNLSVIQAADFLELEYGDWTNGTINDIKAQQVFQRYNQFRSGTRIPGGETMLEAQLRMIAGIEKLCLQHPQQTVAVVSHGDLIKAAITFFAGIHLDLFQRIEISPASVSIVDVFDETARILLVNDTGRLPVE
jgi:probable phosphoglycerate mutase